MTEKKVSLRYAKAMFEVAKERDLLEACYNDMQTIKSLIDSSRELRVLLKSPIINKSKKKGVLENLFKSRVNILTYEFMNLLTDKQRESLIVDVVNQYDILYNEAKNIQVVNITTAVELSETIKQKLVVKLAEVTGKIIQPRYSTKKELVGGIMIRMDNWVYDATIAHQLDILRQQLILGAKL